MADPISTIDDVANLRAITTAVAANPGSIAIENVAGVLKQVTDQGVATTLGGGSGGAGTVTSVAATAGGLLTVAGTPTVAPTVGMDVAAANTIIANVTGGSAVPTAASAAAVRGILGVASSWASTQLSRIAALAPSAGINNVWWQSFMQNVGNNAANQALGWSTAFVGSGAAAQSAAAPSGVLNMATGATANSVTTVSSPLNGAFALYENTAPLPFAIVSRVKLTGAQDTVSGHWPVMLATSNLSDYIIMSPETGIGGVGWTMYMVAAAGATVTVTTAIAPDYSNAHDYMVLFDGTTIGMYIDGVLVPGGSTATLTGIPAVALFLQSQVRNGTTTTSRTQSLDDLALFVPSMA